MQNEKIPVEQAYKTLVVIWSAILMSQLLFQVLIYFVKPEVYKFDFSKPLLGKEPVFVLALAGVSIVNFAMSFVLRKKFLSQSVAEQKIHFVQTAMITGCALCESISLFGLLLVFLQSYQYFFLFFAFAIVGMILHFPRREYLIDASYKK